MVLSIRTTYSGKSNSADENILGWAGSEGLKNQIKAVPRSQYTTRRDKVGMTQIAENESRKRIEELSSFDQYGGNINNTNQSRGKDPTRTVDYAGNSSKNSAAVGLPLGKNHPVSHVDFNHGIQHETIRGKSESVNRQSVHNIKQEKTNKTDTRYSLVKDVDLSKVIKENMLYTTVKPTRIYRARDLPTNFGTQIKTKKSQNIIVNTGTNRLDRFEYKKEHQLNSELTNNRIKIQGNSGVKTLSDFKGDNTLPILESKIKIQGNSGVKTLSDFKGDNTLPTLESKTKIEELYSNKSNSLKHSLTNSFKQTSSNIANRVNIKHERGPNIRKDTSLKLNNNVNLKHKINTSNVSFDSKPNYKTNLNYQR